MLGCANYCYLDGILMTRAVEIPDWGSKKRVRFILRSEEIFRTRLEKWMGKYEDNVIEVISPSERILSLCKGKRLLVEGRVHSSDNLATEEFLKVVRAFNVVEV